MKGISPLIATIILIILTIGIAAILGTWVSLYVGTHTANITQTTEEIVECSLLRYEIISCRKIDINKVRIILLNNGPIEINGLKINFIELDEEGKILNLNSIDLKEKIRKTEYKVIEKDVPSGFQNFKVEIRSIQCPDIKRDVNCS